MKLSLILNGQSKTETHHHSTTITYLVSAIRAGEHTMFASFQAEVDKDTWEGFDPNKHYLLTIEETDL